MTDPIDQLLALSKSRQIRYHARLWRKVDTSDPQGCWEITGYKDDSQYGAYGLFRKTCRAHRVAYALYHQTNPGDLYVLHRCDNRRCVIHAAKKIVR